MVTTSLSTNEFVFPVHIPETFVPHTEYLSYFSPPECKALIELGKSQPLTNGLWIDGTENPTLRMEQTSLLFNTDETHWMWDKLGTLAIMANMRNYHFAISGILTPVEFVVETESHHFHWHMNFGKGENAKRKLTMIIQLSTPNEYEGGRIELFHSVIPTSAQCDVGTAIVFPAFVMHRIAPVTKGERCSLIVHVDGIDTYK